MYAVLHAVSRLMRCPQADSRGLSADVAEALAGEPRLSMATRLGLVALASRIETGDAGECTCRWLRSFRATPESSLHRHDHASRGDRALSHRDLPALLEALSRDDEPQALEALVTCAPALRELSEALARERDPCALLPLALLELLSARLH